MNEYVTKALVLDRETAGEYDSRVFLFTESLGRLTARARSSRKINSKLSGHLEPLTVVQVRLVEKSGFQVVDAVTINSDLKRSTKLREMAVVLSMIKKLTSHHQPDKDLWDLIERGELLGRPFLKVMGFDPDHARCNQCEVAMPSYFVVTDALYRCKACFSQPRSGSSVVALAK